MKNAADEQIEVVNHNVIRRQLLMPMLGSGFASGIVAGTKIKRQFTTDDICGSCQNADL